MDVNPATGQNRIPESATSGGVSQRRRKLTVSSRKPFNDDHVDVNPKFDFAIESAIVGVLFVAPIFVGGRDDIGRLAYFLCVTLFTVVTLARWYVSRLDVRFPRGLLLLLAAGAMVLLVQLLPLNSNVLNVLSPNRTNLLPMWSASVSSGSIHAGVWDIISFVPDATRRSLYVYLAHVGLFLATLQILRNVGDVERLLRWIALAASFMALFGLLQYFSLTEKFSWVFVHPSRNASHALSGPFANANHFAGFLMLGIGPLLWWLQRGTRTSKSSSMKRQISFRSTSNGGLNGQLFLNVCIAIVGFAGAMTMSRGGVLVMVLAGLFAVLGFWKIGLLTRKTVLGLGAAALLLSFTLLFHGVDQLSNELETLASGSIEQLDPSNGRRRVWAANLAAWKNSPILGTGVGSHAEVYPIHFSHPSSVEYTHAESSLLQVLSESGAVGFSLLLTGIVVCVRWCVIAISSSSPLQVRACGVAAASGILAGVIHAIFDFTWHLTACMSVTVMLAACACRLRSFAQESREPQGRLRRRQSGSGWKVSLAMILVLTVAYAGASDLCKGAVASWHWQDYKRLSLRMEREDQQRSNWGRQEEVSDEQVKKRVEEDRDRLISRLQRVLEYDSGNPRANLRMAAILLKQFEVEQQESDNAMTLSDIRSAALASRFSSRANQDNWLSAAIGPSRQLLDSALAHASRALQGCPLHGRGYAYWADLAFLQGWREEAQTQLFSQALAVRPYDASVLFAAGQFAVQLGNSSLAIEYWKRAFHQAIGYRDAIIKAYASRVSPQQFVEMFEPQQDGLERLFEEYRRLGLPEQAKTILPSVVAGVERRATERGGRYSAGLWRRAAAMYSFTEDNDGVIACLRRAVADFPNDFELRKWLALRLVNAKRYEEAVSELAWCLRRQQNDEYLAHCLRLARARRFDPH